MKTDTRTVTRSEPVGGTEGAVTAVQQVGGQGTQMGTGQSGNGADATGTNGSGGNGKGTVVAPGFHLDLGQLGQEIQLLQGAVARYNAFLEGGYPPDQWPKFSTKGLGPSTKGFITGMAGILGNFAVVIGKVPTTMESLNQSVATATALEPILPVLDNAVNLTRGIWGINLGNGKKWALKVYKRALAASDTDNALASALAPFRDALVRIAKKGAKTRKKKDEQPAAPAPAPVAAAPATTTTTTTSLR